MKFKRLKDTIKISDTQYVRVNRGEDGAKVYLVTLQPHIFDKNFTEYSVRLVPKDSQDLEELNKIMSKILEKLSNNELFTATLSSNGFSIVNKLDNVCDTVQNMRAIINDEIQKDKKFEENKNLISSDFFKALKGLDKFKNMDDLELVDLIKEIEEIYLKYSDEGGKY